MRQSSKGLLLNKEIFEVEDLSNFFQPASFLVNERISLINNIASIDSKNHHPIALT